MSAGIEDYGSESLLILEHTMGVDKADFFMNAGKETGERIPEKIEEIVRERKKRVPLQYLFGECEFMGLSFHVDERVLVPRQDTECLAETVIRHISGKEDCRILDLCCGSGCIGLSIGHFCPHTDITLADASQGALEVAKENAEKLGIHADLVQGDLFEHIQGRFDAIVSNPPYIPSEVIEGLMKEVREYEPRMALDGSRDGLLFYRRIIAQAGDYLKEKGMLFFEIGYDQGEQVCTMMKDAGYTNVTLEQDLSGNDRVVYGCIGKEDTDV